MQYVGIHTQKRRNNFRSLILLCLFPVLIIGLIYLFSYLFFAVAIGYQADYSATEYAHKLSMNLAPYVLGVVFIWFIIAYFANTRIINSATGSEPLSRKNNKRVYNLVENLCISQGIKMPKINIINDDSLNAFASGINEKTYTITLSKGIIEKLEDDELEGVIAHELSHIRNNDVRLLIVSIVFVGIFSMIAQVSFNMVIRTPFNTRSRNNKDGGSAVILILLLLSVVAAIGYLLSLLMRFAISRKREYMADASAAEITKRPWALASALRKISSDPDIEAVKREDVAQLFIEHPMKHKKNPIASLNSLFATHPPIENRIKILDQFA